MIVFNSKKNKFWFAFAKLNSNPPPTPPMSATETEGKSRWILIFICWVCANRKYTQFDKFWTPFSQYPPYIYLWSFKIHRYTEAFKNMVLSRVIIGIKIGIFILVFTVTSGSLREHPDSSFLFLVSSFYAGETRNLSRKNRMLSRAKFLVLCQKYWPVVLSCLSNLWWVAPHVTQKSHCIVTFSAECFVAYCF